MLVSHFSKSNHTYQTLVGEINHELLVTVNVCIQQDQRVKEGRFACLTEYLEPGDIQYTDKATIASISAKRVMEKAILLTDQKQDGPKPC